MKFNYLKRFLFLVIGLFLVVGKGHAAQEPDLLWQNRGYKYFKNYSHKEYHHHAQNWCILQDKRGIIYVANQAGVLEYDGISWRVIEIPNQSVFSMAADESGTIYLGGKNEIGYLAPDSRGTLRYVSLLNRFANKLGNFSNAWYTHAGPGGIYFQAMEILARWNPQNGGFNTWKADHPFKASFMCGEKLFIRQENLGLLQMVKDTLKLIPGGEAFAAKKVYMMVPYPPPPGTAGQDQKVLIGTSDNGFYIYDGQRIHPFPTPAGDYLKTTQINHGIRLLSSPGDFALATRERGLVIIDSQGNLKYIFNKSGGLQDDNVRHVYEDTRGNLWLALNNGISKVEYVSRLFLYDSRSNLPGIVLAVIKHVPRNDLYVGTTNGLFRQNRGPASTSLMFRAVPGISANCWSLSDAGDSILAATSNGVYQVEAETNTHRSLDTEPSYVLCRSNRDPQRTWVGTRGGLVSLYWKKGDRWEEEYRFENIPQEIRTIAEDQKGSLWLGLSIKGVLKVDFPIEGKIIPSVVTRCDDTHGLPDNEVKVFTAAGHMMFATGQGLFRFDEKNGKFIPDHTLGDRYAGGPGAMPVFQVAEDRKGNIWFHSASRNYQAEPGPGGTYTVLSQPFDRVPLSQVNAIYPDPQGNSVWLAGIENLTRYDPTVRVNARADFPVLIRKVIARGNLVFDGCKCKYPIKPPGTTRESPGAPMDRPAREGEPPPVAGGLPGEGTTRFLYKDRHLRFEYAALFFEEESQNEYRYYLEGNDDGWSDWTRETKKEYTNIEPGEYRFRVKARNIYGVESREDSFAFRILPPWYKTWWAFLTYGFVLLLLFYLAVKWRSAKLEKEKQRLEQIIEARTKEIHEKNKQLELQTVRLEEQSEKLKEMDQVKSRFFANISHEFRTPLTLIMGPIEQMLATCGDRQQEKQLSVVLRNSQRLLTLIEQLLDLSKSDSGTLRLKAGENEIVSFIKAIHESFSLAAHQKKIDLEFTPGKEEIHLYFDPEKLEKIISNILGNALKFTPAGGKITTAVTVTNDNTHLEISVKDTGIGIPPDRLPYIFDRFYQVEAHGVQDRAPYPRGTGIGLSLARELVRLHHGEIEARAPQGQDNGTEFNIRLPLGHAHLEPGEIVETPGHPITPTAKPYDEYEGEIPPASIDGKEDAEPGTARERIDEEEKNGEKGKEIILVIEDSAEVRDYIRNSLEPTYAVIGSGDGTGGIQKAREIIPDLIISDIMMPGADGYEVCSTLKKDVKTSHIPIILLTAKAAEQNILQGLETGADDYIVKPFNAKILAARIKNLIELRRQLQTRIKSRMVMQPADISVSSIDEEFLKELQAVIEKNLSDSEFKVEQLAKKLYMSRASLYRKIMALTGESPQMFIRTYRLNRAAQLFKANFGNVTEVAVEVGFSNIAYFSQCFKEEFHRLPSTYHASHAGAQPKR